ncbi:oligoribonuclease [Shewanella frigidimarina]|uniref:oligoribonuclease n=1 Tax=Shewanella frigidimarina TaxID=56812 RepID=UPI003D7B6CD1
MNKMYLAWIDLETGGLNGRLDSGKLGMEFYPIFEVALIVTDEQLNHVGEPLRLVIHQTESRIADSHAWAIATHTKSGLLDEVRTSTLTLADAECRIIDHLKALGIESYNRKEKRGAIMAGSSITFDRSYIMCQMPSLNDYLHYRQLDVSSLNLAVRLFKPEIESLVKKEYKHEALADVQESIDELKTYRDELFAVSKFKNFRWKFDAIENAEFIEIRDWFMSAREVSSGLITLTLTQGGFKNRYSSTIIKSEDFKVKALEWASGLLDHYEGTRKVDA